MRQALSSLISCLLLVGISFGIGGVVLSGLLGVSYETMKCEIQLLNVVEILPNNYWGILQVFNNGDHTIKNYELILYGGNVTVTAKQPTGHIPPGEYLKIEFQIDDFQEDEMIMQVDVSNEGHRANCIRQVKA